jgi:hypothetical protein
MSLFISQLRACPSLPWAKDEDVFRRLLSSPTGANGGRDRGDSGLEEKSIQTIFSHSQLDGQRALCLPEPMMELHDVRPWGGLNQIGVGRAFG